MVYAIMGATFLPVALEWGVDQAEPAGRHAVARALALLLLCMVVGHGFRDPAKYLPNAADQDVWLRFRERLAHYGPPERAWVTLHGSVWGAHPRAPMHVHVGALFDYVGGFFGEETTHAVPRDLKDKIEQRYFDVIVVADWDSRARRLIQKRYQLDLSAPAVYLPAFGGLPSSREEFWVPKDGSCDPSAAHGDCIDGGRRSTPQS